MITRHFAFGCSFVGWKWPTVADFIGTAFDQHYNRGNGGNNNEQIFRDLVATHEEYNLDPVTDFVTIGITSCHRMTFFEPRIEDGIIDSWAPSVYGDHTPVQFHDSADHQKTIFARQLESPAWAIWRTLHAVKGMKLFLKALDVPHTIYLGVELLNAVAGFNNSQVDMNSTTFTEPQKIFLRDMIDELLSYVDIRTSIDYFTLKNNFNTPAVTTYEDGNNDQHPRPEHHFKYFQEFFSEFDNPIAHKLLEVGRDIDLRSATPHQDKRWYDIQREIFFCNHKGSTWKNLKVFVNGTFDLLHPGHMALLEFANRIGKHLEVAIDSDRRIKELKGSDRPINNQYVRKRMLECVKYIHTVHIFDSDEELSNIIKSYAPHTMVVGSDYRDKKVIGSEYATELAFFERDTRYSTSSIIESVDNR